MAMIMMVIWVLAYVKSPSKYLLKLFGESKNFLLYIESLVTETRTVDPLRRQQKG
jgi:hypothetical protein